MRLSEVFFDDLGVRSPDERMEVHATRFSDQVGQILSGTENLLSKHRPDRVLLLGDTNSGLSAIVARRAGIPVYHLEAGNRCLDDRVPEEINRRIIDHASSVLMPYTERSRANLIREGISPQSIYVTGNPIQQVIERHSARIDASDCLSRYGLSPHRYLLVTMHRAENVDHRGRLSGIVTGLKSLAAEHGFPVVCSLHPRTRSTAERLGVTLEGKGLTFAEPFGFFDFVALEKSAYCVLTDSGTVQEETCILGVPNVTIREVTERPETVDCGSNVLAGTDPDSIGRCVRFATSRGRTWTPPRDTRWAGSPKPCAPS